MKILQKLSKWQNVTQKICMQMLIKHYAIKKGETRITP